MPLEDPVRKTAESIHKIILFVLYRVPPEKREKFLSRVRGKVQKMNPVEMSGKKVPINSTIGQAISLTKNILNGLNPAFTQQVLQELMVILSQYKGEKTAMLKSAQVDVVIEPFDSAVQSAIRKMKLNPKTESFLKGVTKVIVHRGLGGGKLGYVESGVGKDSRAIHLFKTPILEQARRQGGGLSGRQLDEAFEQALVEVIGHEGGHIQSGTSPQQPFGDEHAAERAAEQAKSIFPADDKPISKRQEDKRPISKRQDADDITDLGYGDYSGSGMKYFDPAAEEVRPTDTQSYEQNVGNMAGGEAQVEAPQGSYGGSGFGLFSIPVGMNSGTVGSLDRPISKRALAISLGSALIFIASAVGGEVIGLGMRTAAKYLSEIREIFKTLFKHANIINKDAENILSWAKKVSPKLHPQAKSIELQTYNCFFSIMKLQTLIGQQKATEQDFEKYFNVLKQFQQNKNSLLGQIEAVHSVCNEILVQRKIKSRIIELVDWRFKKLYNGVVKLSETLSKTQSRLEIIRSKVRHLQEMNQTKVPAKKTIRPDEPGHKEEPTPFM